VVLQGQLSKQEQVIDRLANIPISDEVPVPLVPAHRKRQTRLSPEAVSQLITDYQSGKTIYQLATVYRVHRHTVSSHLQSAGIKIRGHSLTQDQAAEAIRLYLDGWSLAKVGKHFNREHTVIRDVLQRAGIPRRDSHGRPKQ
jgi:hypothetical protein